MLHHLRSATEVAEQLSDKLGQRAFSFISARVEEARQACNQAEVRRWNEVAEKLATQARRKAADGERERCPSLWALMQRIEYCRHRAMRAEREATAVSDARRQELMDLAAQWRELALQAHLVARLAQDSAGCMSELVLAAVGPNPDP